MGSKISEKKRIQLLAPKPNLSKTLEVNRWVTLSAGNRWVASKWRSPPICSLLQMLIKLINLTLTEFPHCPFIQSFPLTLLTVILLTHIPFGISLQRTMVFLSWKEIHKPFSPTLVFQITKSWQILHEYLRPHNDLEVQPGLNSKTSGLEFVAFFFFSLKGFKWL